jgi:drug/metabolite transporter (DMT)-like permease
MLDRLFPKQIDNNYRGYWLALGIFALLVFVRAGQSVKTLVDTRNTAMTTDGIPVDTYDPATAQIVLTMFALLGLNLLVLPILGVVALARYRAMIPLLFLMFLLLQISGRVLAFIHPAATPPGSPPIGAIVNLGVFGMVIIGFFLSLQDRAKWKA